MDTTSCQNRQRYRHVLGKEIRRRREDQGLSLRGFASMIGIDYTYLFKIEHGTTNATIDMLVCIADGLGCEPAELIDSRLL